MNNKFKIGDKIKCVDSSGCEWITKGNIYTVIEIDSDGNLRITVDDGDMVTYCSYRFDLVKNAKSKPEDLTRWMVYGTGCDNKSGLFISETEAKKFAKGKCSDSDWTGRIIGYKLVPVFEAETVTRLKVFKGTKVKAIRRRR